jgi:hypothetical protein
VRVRNGVNQLERADSDESSLFALNTIVGCTLQQSQVFDFLGVPGKR